MYGYEEFLLCTDKFLHKIWENMEIEEPSKHEHVEIEEPPKHIVSNPNVK